MATNDPSDPTEIIPYIVYKDVAAALDWLARAFGFVEDMRSGTPSGGMHGEMSLNGRRIMLGQLPPGEAAATDGKAEATVAIFVYLDNVDAHFERARKGGATIDKPLQDLPYGRSYAARDPEGHVWYFTTPSDAGA